MLSCKYEVLSFKARCVRRGGGGDGAFPCAQTFSTALCLADGACPPACLQENDFLYVHTPIITASDCEGAGEMFQVQNGGGGGRSRRVGEEPQCALRLKRQGLHGAHALRSTACL